MVRGHLMHALVAFCLAAPAVTRAGPLPVWLPDADNLQHMVFWVGVQTDCFTSAGVAVEPVVATDKNEAARWLEQDRPVAAVLPPPMYARLVAEHAPVVLVASLLRHDPIDLVVHPEVAKERALDPAAPLAARLRALSGLRVGVAPNPVTRLKQMLTSQGLDPEHHVDVVVVPGSRQNQALERREVDALFAHTPFLERALVNQGAVLLVCPSCGEVPALANRVIHALAVNRALLARQAELADALSDGAACAARLIREQPEQAVAALGARFPERPRAELSRIVELYARAMPTSPGITTDALLDAVRLYPATKTAPDLRDVRLRDHVYVRSTGALWWAGGAALVALLVLARRHWVKRQ